MPIPYDDITVSFRHRLYPSIREVCRRHGSRMQEGKVACVSLDSKGMKVKVRVEFNDLHEGFTAIEFWTERSEWEGVVFDAR